VEGKPDYDRSGEKLPLHREVVCEWVSISSLISERNISIGESPPPRLLQDRIPGQKRERKDLEDEGEKIWTIKRRKEMTLRGRGKGGISKTTTYSGKIYRKGEDVTRPHKLSQVRLLGNKRGNNCTRSYRGCPGLVTKKGTHQK